MGCHPARSIALLRALTESAQSRLTLITGSRDDLAPDRYTEHREPTVQETEPIRAATRTFSDAPNWDADSFDADLEWELDRLRLAGIRRAIVVDLTKDAFKLPVARVIIPGLEGHHRVPGYIPGKRALAAAAGAA
jgi:ribosomal protein S12 methylthiotransferase accessory factor